jgi:16S rRNA (cytosine1402-N4)-methyltransferase
VTLSAAAHIPVLLEDVIAALEPREGETHVDGTFGAGGYTKAILDTGARVIAFDRDPDAIREGRSSRMRAGGASPLFRSVFPGWVRRLPPTASSWWTA